MFCIIKALILMLVGFVESFIASLNSLAVNRDKRMMAFWTQILNISIGLLTLKYLLKDYESFLSVIPYMLIYAIGMAFGDVIAINFNQFIEKVVKISLGKKRKKKSKTTKIYR